LTLNLKDEVEMFELSEAEKKELGLKSQLDRLILNCYNVLDLITFYTIAGFKETRAWTLKNGLTAPDAGEVVHTDFKEKFIRAEVINWQKLAEAGDWKKAREQGLIQTVGRDYVVKDGDVIEFKI
jgi:ribosome-binding ATPase YchF (GTP1/OBG family)